MATTRPVNIPVGHIPHLDAPSEPPPGAFDDVVVPEGEAHADLGPRKRKSLKREPRTKLGKLIRDARIDKKCTLKDLGKVTGISYRDLCRIELGDGAPPSIERVTRIVSALNLVPNKIEADALVELHSAAEKEYHMRKLGTTSIPIEQGVTGVCSMPVSTLPEPPKEEEYDIGSVVDIIERDLDEETTVATPMTNKLDIDVKDLLTLSRARLASVAYDKFKETPIIDLAKLMGITDKVTVIDQDKAIVNLTVFCQYCGTPLAPTNIRGAFNTGFMVSCTKCKRSFKIDLRQMVKDVLLS